MKKNYLLLIFVFGISAFGQQKGISYQAVIINPNEIAAPGFNGTSIPLNNKAICLSFQILNSVNQVEYQESQSIITDAYGMVNVMIGTGTPGAGVVTTLEAVAWNQGNKKLVVGVNTEGLCSNYIEISNQVLNYTPYSFYAQNADLKDGYVTTSKIADGAITDTKVATGINPSKVGLGNVNNTSDASKPISTATQTALNLKANSTDVIISLALKENLSNKSTNIALDATSTTKYPSVKAIKDYVDVQNAAVGVADGTITSAKIANATIVNADVSSTAAIDFTKLNIQKADIVGLGLNKVDLGLSNVDNTNDEAKPISTATQSALNLKANLASPTFTGTVTSPIYASTPQTLTSGATISWNPSNGLNANVTLDQNSVLNFSNIPASGSYGTLVITQDATGGRTITLPSMANKILGSTSTTTIALSSVANAKDILNFYYDGINCYWNIGQGYGLATSPNSANLASGVTGTLAVTNGGTGATNLTGIVKGNGMNALTAAVPGTDYQEPITLTTTGTGTATLSGTTLNIPNSSFTGGTINNALIVSTDSYGQPLLLQNSSNWQTVFGMSNLSVSKSWEFGVGGLNNNSLGAGKFGIYESNGGYRLAISPGTGNIQIGTTTDVGYKLDVLGDTRVVGNFTTGSVSFPTSHGTSGQVLSTNGSGTLIWSSPSSSASSLTGTLAVTNGGTGATTATMALANLTGTQAANKVLAGPVTNLLSLGSYDGTSLTGWTATGGVSIDVGTFKTTGGNQSMFRDFGQNFKNKTIQFDVKLTAGNTGFTIGAAADGSGGLGLTLRTGTNAVNGLRSTTNWFYTNAAGDTFTFTAGTWYTIKIVTDNGAVGGTSWYVNGVLVGNSGGYFIDNGNYVGIASDNATANFDNISISGVSNATDATPTFRTLVAADIPILNQNTTGNAATATTSTTATNATNVTGTVAVTNGGTGASTKTTAFDSLSPMTTAGDIIYGGLNGTGTRLPKGNNGEFLKLSSGVPIWGSPFSGMGSLDFLGANNRLNVYGNSFEMFGTDSILLNPGTDGQVYIDTYSNGARVATRDYADTKAPLYANINNKSASYTLDASDNGKVLTFDNTSPMTLTVPTGLAAGFNCMIVQKGAGIVTISAAGGVAVINRSGGTKTAGQNAMVTLIALSGTYFISGGDMQ